MEVRTRARDEAELRVFEEEVIASLRAERQKCMLLEQELIEKDRVIKQLKAFHVQLSSAFEECQLELSRIKTYALEANSEVVRKFEASTVVQLRQSELTGLELENRRLQDKVFVLESELSKSKQLASFLQNRCERANRMSIDRLQERATLQPRLESENRFKKASLSQAKRSEELLYEGLRRQEVGSVSQINKLLRCLFDMFERFGTGSGQGLKLKRIWRWLKELARHSLRASFYEDRRVRTVQQF